MIEKFRKIQHSWAIKAILVLTALSFMSLFGVSGYVNSAGANKTIINVDGTKIGLNEIYSLYNRDTQMAKLMLGQDLNITEDMKAQIMAGIVTKEANNLVVEKTANDNGIEISDDLIRQVIQSQPQFFGENGAFDFSLFQRFLAMTYQTEAMYVHNISLGIKRQILVSNMVKSIELPKAYEKYLSQVAGLSKVIEYIKVEPKSLDVGRNISQDELEQYYDDFASEFMAPETRDVSYIYISAKDDYDANVELIDEVEDTIGGGASFAELAKTYKTSIVNVKALDEEGNAKAYGNKKEMVKSSDFVDAAFSYNEAEISNVVETENGFFVVEVNKIMPTYQKPINAVKAQIVKMWKENEQAAIAQEISNDVSNYISEGDSLSDIAKRFSLNIKTTKPLLKDESFEDLSQAQMQEIFNEPVGAVKVFETKNAKIMAVVKSVVKGTNNDATLLEAQKDVFNKEAAQSLINSYGKKLDVRIKYHNL